MRKIELELKLQNLRSNYTRLFNEKEELEKQCKTLKQDLKTGNGGFNKFYDRALRAEGLLKQLKTELDSLTKQNAQLSNRLDGCLYAMALMRNHNSELQDELGAFKHPFKPEDFLAEDKVSIGS